MRIEYIIIFTILCILLTVCMLSAMRSRKAIGGAVAFFICSVLPPIIGNLIIISSTNRTFSTVGYYIYFLGMDILMYSLLRFTFRYCNITKPKKLIKYSVLSLMIIDVIQYALNPFLGQAFETEPVLVDDVTYYRLIPKIGQVYHRIVDYGIFIFIIITFFLKMIHSVRVYAERYCVIFISLVVGGIWETFYIFSRKPIDRSMIGFVVVVICIYYFALYYRPLRLLDRLLANMASELPEGLYFFDINGQCIWANKPGIELAGIEDEDYFQAEKLLTDLFGEFKSFKEDWNTNKILVKGTEKRYYILEKRTIPYSEKKIAGSFLSIRDNTEEQLRLEKEMYSATHDGLTDLYTRQHLYDCIEKTLKEDYENSFVIVYANVNNFKMINDVFGSKFGDHVLLEIAKRIKEFAPPHCIYGRIMGDIFGMCMPAKEFDDAELEAMLGKFKVEEGNVSHTVLVHMGVYFVPKKDIEISVMFDRARMALATIKDDYQIIIAFYDAKMREQVLWDQHISSQLKEAIAQKQITPYLQPIVDGKGIAVGAEVLARWIHPEDGFLSPAKFIPVLEHNGMIAEVDKYMWRCACEILAAWKEQGKNLFLSVNISPKDFYFMDVVSVIKGYVDKYGIAPDRLRIEITETVMDDDNENRMNILNEFRKAGFIVEMDDFGSGYSSLNMLKDMPVDIIKIDMGFLRQSENDDKAQKILHNVINMIYDLGLVSLTEGVETNEQYRILMDMGCRLFQGYHFAKPMPLKEFEGWLKQR